MTGAGPTGRVPLAEARHAAVCLFNARGDYVLALPSLRALAETFGDRLTVVCRPGMASTFFPDITSPLCEPRTDFIDRRHVFDIDHVVERLAGVDLFLSLNPWHHDYLDRLLERLRPGLSAGFHPAFDVHLELDHAVHNLEQNFAAPRLVNPALRLEPFCGPPACDGYVRRAAGKMRRAIPDGWKMLILHAETKPSKTWPLERFSTALDRFLDHAEDVIVLDLGVGPVSVRPKTHTDRVVPFRNLSLPFAMALLGEADMFIGVDSCLLHVADLYRVPGVGLFGPSSPTEFGFRFSRHHHVHAPEMSTIAVDDVVAALLSVYRT